MLNILKKGIRIFWGAEPVLGPFLTVPSLKPLLPALPGLRLKKLTVNSEQLPAKIKARSCQLQGRTAVRPAVAFLFDQRSMVCRGDPPVARL